MRFWLLILLAGTLNASEIGEISELKGIGEISRKDSTDSLIAELASDIFSFDTVKTGQGRMAVEFLDSTVLKLTEHSRVVIDEYIFDPDPSKSKLALNMASGTARFITGKLGKIVDELGQSLIILLPDENGESSGEITVETWAGIEVLSEPFQATMVQTMDSQPTKPVILGNLTLGLINNLLIINQPEKIEEAVEEQNEGPKTDLDKDFFEDAPDLDKDFLEEEEEITRLDIDLLSFDFLIDLLAIVETAGKQKKQKTGDLDGIELTGIVPGFDPVLQTYTFVEGNYIYFVHYGDNTFDIALDKNASAYLEINTAGIPMEIEVNGAGDNTIIIFQSP
jgi:hypothetical protein